MPNSTLAYRLLLLLFCGFLTVSCSDDDEVPPLSNQLEYDSSKYDLGMGLTYDLGPFGFGSEQTHYIQGILLTDAATLNQDPTFTLNLFLFSSGTVVPVTGTFEFADVASMSSLDRVIEKYKWKNFFLNSGLLLDVNKDKNLDRDQEYFEIINGTITLSGTAPNYTIACDVTLETGKQLKAQYTGTFIPIPTTTEDEDMTVNRRKAPATSPFVLRAPNFSRVN
jgi:hypothetical protein